MTSPEDEALHSPQCTSIIPKCVFTQSAVPPSSPCENNARVKTTRGVGSTTFGTVEFGDSIFWWSLKMNFCPCKPQTPPACCWNPASRIFDLKSPHCRIGPPTVKDA